MSVGLARKGRREELVTGDKHDHKVQRTLDLLAVPLARKAVHLRSQGCRVPEHRSVRRSLVLRLLCLHVCRRRCLCVHHHGPLLRQVDGQVGPLQRTLHGSLLGEIAVVHHACQLNNASKLDFTPTADLAVVGQGIGEPPGLRSQNAALPRQRLNGGV